MNYKEVSELPNFQGAINQIIGQAGTIAALSGATQERREKKALGKQEQILAQAAEIAGSAPQADVEGTVAHQTSQDIAKERTEIAKKQFEMSPTREGYKKYSELRSAAYNLPIARLPADEDAQVEAMDRMNIQSQAKKKQQDKIKRYVDINAMYDRVKKGEISQDEYEAWFSALPGSQPDDDR